MYFSTRSLLSRMVKAPEAVAAAAETFMMISFVESSPPPRTASAVCFGALSAAAPTAKRRMARMVVMIWTCAVTALRWRVSRVSLGQERAAANAMLACGQGSCGHISRARARASLAPRAANRCVGRCSGKQLGARAGAAPTTRFLPCCAALAPPRRRGTRASKGRVWGRGGVQ